MRSCTARSRWRSPHSPASTETQAHVPMGAGTSWASGATVLLRQEVFKAFSWVFHQSPCCAPRQMPHTALPRLKEGLLDTGRVEAGFIPASVRAEVYAKVQVFSYLEIFQMGGSSSTANQAVVTCQQGHWCNHRGAERSFPEWFLKEILDQSENALCFFHRISCAASPLPLFTLPFQLLQSQNTAMEHLKQQGWVGRSFPPKCCGELSMDVLKKQFKYDPTASHRSFFN